MTTVTIATVDTVRYSFLAVGHNADHARDILMSTWRRHVEQTGAIPDHVTREDINVTTASVGQSFRDGEPFPDFHVSTWADGYGRWHAYVTVPNVGNVPSGMIYVARDAVADQIVAREESPTRSAAEIRENVHVELIEKGRIWPSGRIRFHYAETL